MADQRWPPGTRQVFYCSNCMCYIAETGEYVPYDSDDVIVWVECTRCLDRRLEKEALEEERRRQEEELARPVVCELEGCEVEFVRGRPWQKFCSDEHRWLAAWRARRSKTA